MKVYNKYHKNSPENAVYIGRPSFWGNPFAIGVDGDRDQVIDLYRDLLDQRLQDPQVLSKLKTLSQAAGLVCFCAPKRCHGHVLIEAMKRHKFLALEIGDPVQWVSNGIYQFTEPKRLVNIVTDPVHGQYAFIENCGTGMPFVELRFWNGLNGTTSILP